MTDWTIYNNLLPWCALTVEQMRAFEASEGEMIWLTSDGGWHPINPPVAPGWIIRVAELAIEDLIEEHEKRALAPQPEADPVREAAIRDKIARIITLDHLQLLSDFDVDGDLYRLDPECSEGAYATADAILRALAQKEPRND